MLVCFFPFTILHIFLTLCLLLHRELREKEEIEKYRMERPKIQQQFSDLKVHFVLYTFLCTVNTFYLFYSNTIYCMWLRFSCLYARFFDFPFLVCVEEIGWGYRRRVVEYSRCGWCQKQETKKPTLWETHTCARQFLC